MPPKENSEMSCEECIHYFACSMQCGGDMRPDNANHCECYEPIKSSMAYYVGTLDGAKGKIPNRLRELPCPHDGSCTQKKVWERLKAYEDTGLSPQACAEAREIEETLSNYDYSISRMVELMKADKDRRVVVLPCEVGTATYYIRYPIATYPDKNKPEIKRGIFTLYDLDRLGHSVFLTREEAEKAMKGETEK